MFAKIYIPARNAMQSGQANMRDWVLEFVPEGGKVLDPLMGWTGSGDTQAQVRLRFASQAEAEAYAVAQGIEYVVQQPKDRAANIRLGGYGENFATNRRQVWTH